MIDHAKHPGLSPGLYIIYIIYNIYIYLLNIYDLLTLRASPVCFVRSLWQLPIPGPGGPGGPVPKTGPAAPTAKAAAKTAAAVKAMLVDQPEICGE